ncbi:MAG TPA: alanine racemase [Clostridia bacterium]|nr:alanine racemase [Clostridia bacterium]
MDGISSSARTWAEIDLGNLLHNFKLAKECKKPVMCVIKADAYGHGAVRCGRFLEENGADAFAVACLAEAVELRDGGVTKPILILGYTAAEYAGILAKRSIVQTLVDESHALEMSAAATAAGASVECHIKLDTGMSRAGLFAQGADAAHEAALAAERMMKLPGLNVTGMYTHFAVADTPGEDDYTAWQLANYNTVLGELTKKGLRPETCHTSNSAGILYHPETVVDMVREGIMLYGLYPDSAPQSGPLKPVMTLRTRVSQVRDFPADTTVSYGRTFRGSEPFTTAVMLAGYADGYPRRLSGNTSVTINGEKYPQAGRICMDMSMALVDKTKVKRGDIVTLVGGDSITWEEAAGKVGTINYELTCLVTARAERIYVNG